MHIPYLRLLYFIVTDGNLSFSHKELLYFRFCDFVCSEVKAGIISAEDSVLIREHAYRWFFK